MSDYRKQVEEAIQAIVVDAPTSYWWFGKRSPQLSKKVKLLLTRNTARNYLLFNLQSQLYSDFYCRGFAAPDMQAAAGLPPVGKTPFVEEVSAGNCGTGYWEDGWEVGAVKHGDVIVHKGGLQLWVHSEDCLIAPGASIGTGLRVSLRFPKELLQMSPGFYMALGNEGLADNASQDMVRFYWNLTAVGALLFIKRATLLLNRERLPFGLKVLNDRHSYSRCDAVVLYTHKRDYKHVANALREIYEDVFHYVKQGTPVFTKRLAPGVGLAEDPGQDVSFGEHRCRLLADGIIRAYEQGKKSLEARFQAVAERFAEDNIDLEEPFLNPGSSDEYYFAAPLGQPIRKSRGTKLAPQTDFDKGLYLRTAEEIASRLSQEAVWHGDRCNWLGVEPMDFSPTSRQPVMSYRALGPELYNGTSGVALFLAEFYAATGDVPARRTALGAISQALSRVDALSASSRLGLFTGAVGVAFAAARVGIVLGEEELLKQASDFLRRLASDAQPEGEFDLICGAAGAIAALVSLRDILNDNSLMAFATRLADNLLQAADKSPVGYSWGSPAFPKQRNLTGFSHGAAGIGYALLELFQATGKTEYRTGAERAFDYEHHWFDADTCNWPDFREEPGQSRRRKAPQSFATLWCHGAPGIALSRLRAFKILNDDAYKAEAVTALQTTSMTIRRWLYSGAENYSLCHGLAGNAEVLLHGCQGLGQELTEDLKLVAEVANAGVEAYGKRGGQWPCGTGAGETPGLMLGLAGIGYFYLRLLAPKIPSILILQRESLCTRS